MNLVTPVDDLSCYITQPLSLSTPSGPWTKEGVFHSIYYNPLGFSNSYTSTSLCITHAILRLTLDRSYIRGTIRKYQNGTPKVARNSLILGRTGTWYVAMVTKLPSSYCGAHLVESYCEESNISDSDWPRYLSSSYLIKI